LDTIPCERRCRRSLRQAVTRGNLTASFTGGLNIGLKADVPLYMAVAIPYRRFLCRRGRDIKPQPGAARARLLHIRRPRRQIFGFGDVVPMFNMRWNDGFNNFMACVTGNITVGRYYPTRLANLGIGHNVIDIGGAYTYLNPQTGNEFSAVLDFTYNFENVHTQYQDGIDMHLDVSASHFVQRGRLRLQAAHLRQRLRRSCRLRRVAGGRRGPAGYITPLGTTHQALLSVKAYREFAAEHWPNGWNAWLTFAISPAAPTAAPRRPMLAK
jgi:hypothetical protein